MRSASAADARLNLSSSFCAVQRALAVSAILRDALHGSAPNADDRSHLQYAVASSQHHELANFFCPKDFAELTVHARAKLRRTQRRKTLIAAFWKQAGHLLSLGGDWKHHTARWTARAPVPHLRTALS
jgi:hypothetical protein